MKLCKYATPQETSNLEGSNQNLWLCLSRNVQMLFVVVIKKMDLARAAVINVPSVVS